MSVKGDIEALFYYFDNRKVIDGFRPAHLINDYLTTGLHHYYCNDDTLIKGSITFITPEAYPNSLSIGKAIEMYDGSNKIGYAIVIKILNPILRGSKGCLLCAEIHSEYLEDQTEISFQTSDAHYYIQLMPNIKDCEYLDIDIICADIKTNRVYFTLLNNDLAQNYIEMNKHYMLFENDKKIGQITVLEKYIDL